MMMSRFGLLSISALLLTILPACSKPELSISNAWIPEAPSGVPALAAYMTVENGFNETRTLRTASSTLFEHVEIHRTFYEKDSGLARMQSLEQIEIEPEGSFLLQPGGHHLMLIGPKRALQAGDKVALTLIFDDRSRRVEFAIRREDLRW